MASITQQIVQDSNYSKVGAQKNKEQKTSLTSVSGDEFLMLMTEQLKYQDPMDPMDNNDMLAQEAQFQSLSQMEELNKCFSQFSNVFQANALLGQCVRVEVDGQGFVGVVEGVNFNDVNGASVFVGDRYYPMSSITNVYWLTAGEEPSETPKTTEDIEKELTDKASSKNKNSDIQTLPFAKYVMKVPESDDNSKKNESQESSKDNSKDAQTSSLANTAMNLFGGNVAKKVYEYAKQAVSNL